MKLVNEMTVCKHVIYGKFSTGKPSGAFKCKFCGKKKPALKRIHKIVFGRRRWYDLCQDCFPGWIIFKKE